ncbi:hypothetical protein NCAS_0B05070 [Naumovozyma castellii]|uniref:Protein GIS3 n=1 Tax=Naumovozyma castellii TaxID=27288 RepID=G0V9H5_NAUCA|nr:hypothetical protein NCAS_0B05070 [Naumovozyma castellii CBS 4309]CCC68591.1 hypothetical protein NCAS_0B05070 [Naumovozyma castellii CBS 4309]
MGLLMNPVTGYNKLNSSIRTSLAKPPGEHQPQKFFTNDCNEAHIATLLPRTMNELHNILKANPRGRKRPQGMDTVSKSGVIDLDTVPASRSITPSMNSVLSQIKKYKGDTCEVPTEDIGDATEDRRIREGDQLERISFVHDSTAFHNNTDSEINETDNNIHSLSLDVENNANGDTKDIDKIIIPRIKLLNFQDLDLHDNEWVPENLIQLYKPIYERPKANRYTLETDVLGEPIQKPQILKDLPSNQRTTIPSIASKEAIVYDHTQIELKPWAPLSSSYKLEIEPCVDEIDVNDCPSVPLRRTRQQNLNPNFLRLYSIEKSCRLKKILPEINIDERALGQLSYDDIRSLDISANNEGADEISSHDVKLALITKKKLWSEMLCEVRQDTYGDSSPWNLNFIATSSHDDNDAIDNVTAVDTDESHSNVEGGKGGQERRTSLVRLYSDLKPWLNENRGNSTTTTKCMLKPCGKLTLDKRYTSRKSVLKSPAQEIQYVVKGWCDDRFIGRMMTD